MPRGEREVMGNRWQFMFAVGQVLTLAIVAIFIVVDLPHDVIWRVTLGLGAVPAAIILYLRHDLPETAIWLIRHGRFREAKQVTASMYGDRLDMLPDEDVEVARPSPDGVPCRYPQGPDPLARHALRLDRLLRAERRVLDLRLLSSRAVRDGRGFRRILGTTLVTIALYIIAAISGWIGPLITPRIGQRGISIAGFAIVFAVAARCRRGALYRPRRRSAVCGGGHAVGPLLGRRERHDHSRHGREAGISRHRHRLRLHLRQAAGLPVDLPVPGRCSRRSARPTRRSSSALFPLIGLLAAIFILPEIYGFEHD